MTTLWHFGRFIRNLSEISSYKHLQMEFVMPKTAVFVRVSGGPRWSNYATQSCTAHTAVRKIFMMLPSAGLQVVHVHRAGRALELFNVLRASVSARRSC